jgi:excisionase family DNA binding protein
MATSRIRLELSEVEIAAIAQRVAAIIVSGGTQPRGDSPQRFLTPAEAAQYLRCSRQRIYDLCSAGTLSRFRDGTRVLISRAEIDEHVQRTATKASSPPHAA